MYSPVAVEATFNFQPLLILLLLAFLVPILLARVRSVPVVVGEILAGVIVGGSVLGLVEEDIIIALMSDIGLAFLMFLAGLEIDFDMLFPGGGVKGSRKLEKPAEEGRKEAANPLALAAIIYALTLALAASGAAVLVWLGLEGNVWLLTFILSATSLGVLLPVLKERGLSRTPFGQVVFVSATLADFIAAILLTIFLIIQANGLDPQIFTISLLFLFFFVAYRLGLRFTQLPVVRRMVEELSRATVQLKVRGAITILLAFVVLAEYVNAELILGAFLAGMVISLLKSKQDEGLVHNLEAFGFGFFIPVFFILVGVNLDIGSLLESPQSLLLVPVFLLISLVVKMVPMLAARSMLSWREMLGAGLLLNTHLSLEIAVAVIGARAGLLSPAAATSITLFAILTVLIMPLLFGAVAPKAPEAHKRKILVCNAGGDGLSVARELKTHGEMVSVLDDDTQVLAEAQREGFETLEGRPDEIAEEINAREYKGILALCFEDSANLALGRAAKRSGVRPVIARINDPANLEAYRELDIQPYLPAVAQHTLLTMMVRNPDFYSLLTSATDGRDVREIGLDNYAMHGRKLRDFSLPGGALVMTISRNGEVIIPHGDSQLEVGDRLTLLGSLEELGTAEDVLKGRM